MTREASTVPAFSLPSTPRILHNPRDMTRSQVQLGIYVFLGLLIIAFFGAAKNVMEMLGIL